LTPREGRSVGELGRSRHVTFLAGRRQAVTVPTIALVEHGQLESLFVNAGGVAHARLVTLGDKREGEVEVLSGLQRGDRVICPVPPGLTDGDRVAAHQ
jgi:hypothetical protein